MHVSIDLDQANPNPYEDEAYTTACNDLNSAVEALYEAGALEAELEDTIENALKNAGAS